MAPKDMLGGVGVLPFQDPLTLGWLRYHGGEGPCFPVPTHLDSQTLSLEGDTLLTKKMTSSYSRFRTGVALYLYIPAGTGKSPWCTIQ